MLFAALLLPPPAAAATFTVADEAELADALALVAPGDTVELGPGTYDASLDLTQPVALVGAGIGLTVLEPTDGAQVVHTTADVALTGLTLDGGGDRPALLVTAGTATLQDVQLAWGSSLTGGGGAHVDGPDAVLICTGCSVRDNHGELGGGGVRVAQGRFEATASRFVDNHGFGGGALWVEADGEATVRSSVLCGNTTHAGAYVGGAIRATGPLVLEASVLAENIAATNGGALHVDGTAAKVVRNNTFHGNDALDAAALHHEAGPLLWVNNLVAAHPQGTAVVHVAGALDAASGHQLYQGNAGDSSVPFPTDLHADPRLDPQTLDCHDPVPADGLFLPLDGSAMVGTGDGTAGLSDDIGHLDLDGPVADQDGDGFDVLADCDDDDALVFPGAAEVCNGVDDDCDGVVNEAAEVGAEWLHPDRDGDGYGAVPEALAAWVCEDERWSFYLATPDGEPSIESGLPPFPYRYINSNTDCNDADPTFNPAAPETCDGLDRNCNGDPYDVVPTPDVTYFVDADRDGHGTGDWVIACDEPPAGYVAEDGDCDDTDPAVSPDANELPCDGVDNDCTTITPDDDGTCSSTASSSTASTERSCGCRTGPPQETPVFAPLTRRRGW